MTLRQTMMSLSMSIAVDLSTQLATHSMSMSLESMSYAVGWVAVLSRLTT
jgi:hypothetical protein